jgi:hypothetical protein
MADASDPDYALVEEMADPEKLTPGWQASVAFVFEFVLFGSVLALVRRLLNEREAIDL